MPPAGIRIDDLPTAALIEHIRARYHEPHRAALADLTALATRIVRAHVEAPRDLVRRLEALRAEIEAHMAKEETVLFPMMLGDGNPAIGAPLGRMRHGHDAAAGLLAALRAWLKGVGPAAGSGGPWGRLHTGLDRLAADLAEHLRLENEVLFPRFKTAAD